MGEGLTSLRTETGRWEGHKSEGGCLHPYSSCSIQIGCATIPAIISGDTAAEHQSLWHPPSQCHATPVQHALPPPTVPGAHSLEHVCVHSVVGPIEHWPNNWRNCLAYIHSGAVIAGDSVDYSCLLLNSPASAVSRFRSMNTPSHTEIFKVLWCLVSIAQCTLSHDAEDSCVMYNSVHYCIEYFLAWGHLVGSNGDLNAWHFCIIYNFIYLTTLYSSTFPAAFPRLFNALPYLYGIVAEEVTLGVSVGGLGVWSVKKKFDWMGVSKAINESVCKPFWEKALKNGAMCLSLSI